MMGNYNALYIPLYALSFIFMGIFFLLGSKTAARKGQKRAIVQYTLIAFIFYIGITVGSNNDKSNQIADAIQENTELKLKVNELNDQIAQMQEEIDSLHAELEAMPTIEPTLPSGSPAPSVSPTSPISPRIGVQ